MLHQDNLRTITDMRQKALQILEYADKNDEPVFILQHSRPRGVILGFERYQKLMEALEDHLDAMRGEKILTKTSKKYLSLENFWKKNKLSV